MWALAHSLFFLGDLASKPMHWEMFNNDFPLSVWICSKNYDIYNWLMLKSVVINDKYDFGIWLPYNDDLELNEDDDKFTPIRYTKKD